MDNTRSSKPTQDANGQVDVPNDPLATSTASQVAAEPADPFNPERLRLPQNYGDKLGVRRAYNTIQVRKPDKTWFVRVHPSSDYRLQTCVIELKEDRETYLVVPELQAELAIESTFTPMAFFTAITRQSNLFLWPVKLPGIDGKTNDWNQSAMDAAAKAVKGWVRVVADMQLGGYEVYEAAGDISDPEWPDLSFNQVLRTAFKNYLIDSLDHPVLRKLRGEI